MMIVMLLPSWFAIVMMLESDVTTHSPSITRMQPPRRSLPLGCRVGERSATWTAAMIQRDRDRDRDRGLVILPAQHQHQHQQPRLDLDHPSNNYSRARAIYTPQRYTDTYGIHQVHALRRRHRRLSDARGIALALARLPALDIDATPDSLATYPSTRSSMQPSFHSVTL